MYCSLFVVARCSLCVARCLNVRRVSLFVVCCWCALLIVVACRCVMFVVCVLFCRCVLFDGVSCLLYEVVRCLLVVVCCSLFVVRCLSCIVVLAGVDVHVGLFSFVALCCVLISDCLF